MTSRSGRRISFSGGIIFRNFSWPRSRSTAQDTVTAYVPPCHQRRASGSVLGSGGVGIRESHALSGEPIDMRCFVEPASVTLQVGPAEIVCEDEHDVRWTLRAIAFGLRHGRDRRAQKTKAENQ